MNYTENTCLHDILQDHPWLGEVLPEMDARFAAMNSFAGKLMLKRMTVKDLSRLSGYSSEKLLNKLERTIAERERGEQKER